MWIASWDDLSWDVPSVFTTFFISSSNGGLPEVTYPHTGRHAIFSKCEVDVRMWQNKSWNFWVLFQVSTLLVLVTPSSKLVGKWYFHGVTRILTKNTTLHIPKKNMGFMVQKLVHMKLDFSTIIPSNFRRISPIGTLRVEEVGHFLFHRCYSCDREKLWWKINPPYP